MMRGLMAGDGWCHLLMMTGDGMMRKFRMIVAVCLVMLCAGVMTARQAYALDDQEKKAKSLAAYAIGVIYDFYGHPDLAVEEFNKASGFKDSYVIRLRLGADYARLGELSLAVQHLDKALEFDPDNVQARYLLALIYSTRKEYDRAAQEYEAILNSFVEAEPRNSEIYGYLAQLYYSQKQYDKAIKQFEIVLSLEPQNAEVMFLLGALYLEKGDETGAVDLLEKTLILEPGHDAALNSLAYIYAQRGEQLDRAGTMIERALTIDPGNGAYLDTRGWIAFQKGDWNAALTDLHQAEEALDDPVIFEHLGDVYFRMKDLDQARQNWEKSLELNSDQPSVIEKIRAIIPQDPLTPLSSE